MIALYWRHVRLIIGLLLVSLIADGSETVVVADSVVINPETIPNSGISVTIAGTVDDVELMYAISVPSEYNDRKFSSFLVLVQVEDEVSTVETITSLVDGKHDITISQTNLDDRNQVLDVQATYVADNLTVLIVRFDLVAFASRHLLTETGHQ